MEQNPMNEQDFDRQIAQRLRALRAERGWSLDELAKRSGVSRATLSRLENGEVSPTAAVLGKLGTAYGLVTSRMMRMIEETYTPLVPRAEQTLWVDPETGFRRRSVSPPARTLTGEVIEGELPPGSRIDYAKPTRPGLEHHLILLEGELEMIVGDQRHHLKPGDCLRYQLFGPNSFITPPDRSARYLLFMI
jgi:transcriptional regulator with XRE-family HTH domain